MQYKNVIILPGLSYFYSYNVLHIYKGSSGPSLLIESTDSMICLALSNIPQTVFTKGAVRIANTKRTVTTDIAMNSNNNYNNYENINYSILCLFYAHALRHSYYFFFISSISFTILFNGVIAYLYLHSSLLLLSDLRYP